MELAPVAAAAAVQSDIVAGCDLVLLNKFGKLEIAGDGLANPASFRLNTTKVAYNLRFRVKRLAI